MDSTLIRISLDLPLATLHVDLEEAHDTVLCEGYVCKAHHDAAISSEELGIGAALVCHSSVQVHLGPCKSRAVRLGIGFPEGRRLAAVTFASAAAGLPAAVGQVSPGVGLDPPEDAVIAYRLAADGSNLAPPLARQCIAGAARVRAGRSTWLEEMRKAASDTDRLTMIDLACRTRVRFTQFHDDGTLPSSSLGSLASDTRALEGAIGKMFGKIKLGKGKTEYSATGICSARPVQCGEGEAARCETRSGLGLTMDAEASLYAQLAVVEARGHSGLHSLLVGMEQAGMSIHAVMQAVERRLLPRTCHGAEFLLLRADWRVRLDQMQETWLRRILGLAVRIARAVLLADLCVKWRLSAYVLRRALQLLARVEALPPHHPLAGILEVALQHPSSWASCAADNRERLGIVSFASWMLVDPEWTPPQRKRALKKYTTEILTPIIDDRENQWQHAELAKHGLRAVQTTSCCPTGLRLRAVRSWAQLRLQRRFSLEHLNPGLGNACPLCLADNSHSAEHLLLCCSAGIALASTVPIDEHLRPGIPDACLDWLDYPQDHSETRAAILIAATLRRGAEQALLRLRV